MATDHGPADGEFWLPPQFLSDEETHPQGTLTSRFCEGAGSRFFPQVDYGNRYRSSNLSSPGDSVVGSAEESDNEEDFIADLTRKVVQSTLEDDFDPRHSKSLLPSGSPTSTLCGACGCGHALSRGSPNGVTQMKPVQPLTLDVLYKAAGKVASMRLSQQQKQIDCAHYLQKQLHQQQRLNHLIRLHNPKSDVSFYPSQAASQPSLSQFNHLPALGSSRSKYAKADPVVSFSARPTLQQAQHQPHVQGSTNSNSGAASMHAVFLGSSNGVRQGSCGTGVFLPRRAGVDPEPKRKQGSSTVLIPAKVVHALNLNLEEMNPPPPFNPPLNGRVATESYGAWRIRDGRQVGHHQQRAASLRGQPAVYPEISLPSEWTY